jgi:hypothetical protein
MLGCARPLFSRGGETISKLAKRPTKVGCAGIIDINRESVRANPNEPGAPKSCQASRNFSRPAVSSYSDYHFRSFELLQICEGGAIALVVIRHVDANHSTGAEPVVAAQEIQSYLVYLVAATLRNENWSILSRDPAAFEAWRRIPERRR